MSPAAGNFFVRGTDSVQTCLSKVLQDRLCHVALLNIEKKDAFVAVVFKNNVSKSWNASG
jgi:hypothetical protein